MFTWFCSFCSTKQGIEWGLLLQYHFVATDSIKSFCILNGRNLGEMENNKDVILNENNNSVGIAVRVEKEANCLIIVEVVN